MNVLRFDILLDQPLLATQQVSDPNSVRSHEYIPGSTLRGLLALRYLARPGGAGADETFQRIFLSGAARFLNAYPLDRHGERSLPTPRSLRKPKGQGQGGTVYNALVAHQMPARPSELGAPFCAADGQALALYQPDRTIAIHVARDPRKGRAWIERNAEGTIETPRGTVFRYEALAAGQWFGAAVLCDDPEDQALLAGLLDDAPCWLGRSRSAMYGRAQLHRSDDAGWREPAAGAPLADGAWTLTLLSDALLYDALGDPAAQIDGPLLSAYLGVAVEVDPDRTFIAHTSVGGFNRTWRMPLLQAPALAAGSVITFRPIVGATLDSAALEREGIGDRREDGFGRLALNWLTQATYAASEGRPYQRTSTTTVTSTVGVALASRMAARLLDQRIDEAIADFIRARVWPQVQPRQGDEEQPRDHMPTNSQLARLQRAVREALPTGDLSHVGRTIEGFRDYARASYERAQLTGSPPVPLLRWITRLLGVADTPDRPLNIWDELGIAIDKLPAVARQQAAHDERLERVTRLRLLMAVLAAPAQRRKSWEVVDAQTA